MDQVSVSAVDLDGLWLSINKLFTHAYWYGIGERTSNPARTALSVALAHASTSDWISL